MTETYLLSAFPAGLSEDAFKGEIAASAITETCLDVGRFGTDPVSVNIVFTGTLSTGDKTILDGLVAAHVPPPTPVHNEAFVLAGSHLIQHNINGTLYNFIGNQSNEIHISKETQGHFSSIKAALLANPGPNHIFIVHPAEYIEDNPLDLPTGTVLVSWGNAENTFITAQNPNSIIANVGIKCKIDGFTFRNAPGGVGIYFNCAASGGYGRYTAISQCFIVNCGIAVDVDGQNINLAGGIPDTLYCRELIINASTNALSKGIQVRRGGQFISSSITCFGIPPSVAAPSGVPIAYGYYCTDIGSKIAMAVANCYFCGAGLYLDAGCQSELMLLTIKYNANGVVIGPNGTTTRFSVNSLEISGTTQKDVTVLATAANVEVHSGVFDDSKISNPNGARLNMRYYTNSNGKTRQRMLGIINVGTPLDPAKMFIGEGSYDLTNSVYYRNDNGEAGTWTDVTADANEDTGNVFSLFSGTAAGNCLYIGRDVVPVGIKLNVNTAVSGGIVHLADLAWEYWNGTTWIAFEVMQTSDITPYYFVGDSALNTAGSYHIRFGLRSDAPLVAKTLNGVSKKWTRVRVVNALPSIPDSNYILAHTNVAKIGGDGYTEYFGDARTVKKLTWNLYDMDTVGGVNQTVYFGQKLYSSGVGNMFTHGVDCRLGLSAFMPTDVDNSFALKIIISVIGTVAGGDTTLTIRYNFSNEGADLYLMEGNAPAQTSGEMTITAVKTIVAAYKETRITVLASASGININPSGQGPQTLWMSVERTAGDAYTGDLVIAQISGYYVSWVDGAHLLAY